MLIKCPECARDVSDTAPSCPGCGYVLNAPPTPPRGSPLDFPGPSTEAQILVEQRVTNEGPSAGVAYLLGFFLGLLSGHRFYLGRPVTAVLQILSYFILVGFLWWIIDAFLIPEMLREKRGEIRKRLLQTASGQPAEDAYKHLPSYHARSAR